MAKRNFEQRNLPEVLEIPDEHVDPPDDPLYSIVNNNAFKFNDVQPEPDRIVLDVIIILE